VERTQVDTTTRASAAAAAALLHRCPRPAMDLEARHQACVYFRVKLRGDTGANLTAADCAGLLDTTFECVGGEQVTLQSNPGLFYVCLGEAIADQKLAPWCYLDHVKVAAWCYRQAAEVHAHPAGLRKLALCYNSGWGVQEDPPQAAVWLQKAAALGDAASKSTVGALLLDGDERAGVAKDAARGFELARQAFAQGFRPALYNVARCYLSGDGVEKDAATGVCLLRQVIAHEGAATASAQFALAQCYAKGEGVERGTVEDDTLLAALWCQRAARGGYAVAIELLPVFRDRAFSPHKGPTPWRRAALHESTPTHRSTY